MAPRFEFRYGETITPDQMRPRHIYLDGACQGPAVRMDLPAISFDHHAGCVRAFTLATCQQVWTSLALGLDLTVFETVVTNDIDADTVVSAWLLGHAQDPAARAMMHGDHTLDDLVARVGFVDAHGPVVTPHPMHNALTLPRDRVQTEGDLANLLDRLQRWYDTGEVPRAKGPQPAPWRGVRVDGSIVEGMGDFSDAYGKGAVVALAMVPAPEGTIGYTIGKRSEFVRFNVRGFLTTMNDLESGWGGGSTIGGAPRRADGSRSRLAVDVVWGTVLDVLARS